jgi:hypothetical protein
VEILGHTIPNSIVALKSDAPRHLVLGRIGHDLVMKRLAERMSKIGRLRELAPSAEFPAI